MNIEKYTEKEKIIKKVIESMTKEDDITNDPEYNKLLDVNFWELI